ncbi:nuclear transport factor 2 family protein [Dactylosporangium salmoneum]|uniref:Nuclear transport factor 2 family protein n=1 Tax=Dactylosporangium salmoneum TaxID=53361 RepID=A0ABP5SZ93_9ACTN
MNNIPDGTVRRLADRAEIADCLGRYARGMDRLDRDLVLSAYHPDAVDDHGKFVGSPAEFVRWSFAMHRQHHHSHLHAILHHSCELDGDTAHTEAYFMFLSMNRTGAPWSASAGRYIDRFERRDGRWAIAHRLCVRDWAATDGPHEPADPTTLTSTSGSLSDAQRMLMRSAPPAARDRSDPSYRRPLVADPQRLLRSQALLGDAATRGEEG